MYQNYPNTHIHTFYVKVLFPCEYPSVSFNKIQLQQVTLKRIKRKCVTNCIVIKRCCFTNCLRKRKNHQTFLGKMVIDRKVPFTSLLVISLVIYMLMIRSPETQDVNWTYIRRSEDVQDVFVQDNLNHVSTGKFISSFHLD